MAAHKIQLPDIPHVELRSEQATLGAMITTPEVVGEVVALLEVSDFQWPPHQTIFRTILGMQGRGEVADINTLPDELERIERAEAIGGIPYIHALTDARAFGVADTLVYARRVLATANVRRIGQAGRDIIAVAKEASDDAELGSLALGLIQAATERSQPQRPQPTSALELLSKKLPPIHYVVPKYLPQGMVIIHAAPKAGKTRLADSLALAVATGGMFLGKLPVKQAGVCCLYLEDSVQDTQERLKAAVGDHVLPEGLDYFWEWKRIDLGGYSDLEDYLKRHPQCKLLIIDTLELVRPPQNDRGNIYSQDVHALKVFKKLANEYRICLMLIHHSKKGSATDDLVDGASGTAGVGGSADTVIRLRRKAGTNEAVLEGRGRKVRDFELAIALDEIAGWQLIGDAAEVNRTAEEKEVVALLSNEPLRPNEIAEELGLSRTAARQRCRRMGERGLLLRARNGAWYANPAPPPDTDPPEESPVTGVHPVHPVSRVSPDTLSHLGTPQLHLLKSEQCDDPNAQAPNGTEPVTGATGVTGSTPDTPVTPCTPVTGCTPVTPPVSQDPRTALRIAACDLGFLVIEHEGLRIGPGETAWSRFCREGETDDVLRALGLLEALRGK